MKKILFLGMLIGLLFTGCGLQNSNGVKVWNELKENVLYKKSIPEDRIDYDNEMNGFKVDVFDEYKFSPTVSSTYTFSLSTLDTTSEYDNIAYYVPTFKIYSDENFNVEVESYNTDYKKNLSLITVDLEAGKDYYIKINNYNDIAGNYSIILNKSESKGSFSELKPLSIDYDGNSLSVASQYTEENTDLFFNINAKETKKVFLNVIALNSNNYEINSGSTHTLELYKNNKKINEYVVEIDSFLNNGYESAIYKLTLEKGNVYQLKSSYQVSNDVPMIFSIVNIDDYNKYEDLSFLNESINSGEDSSSSSGVFDIDITNTDSITYDSNIYNSNNNNATVEETTNNNNATVEEYTINRYIDDTVENIGLLSENVVYEIDVNKTYFFAQFKPEETAYYSFESAQGVSDRDDWIKTVVIDSQGNEVTSVIMTREYGSYTGKESIQVLLNANQTYTLKLIYNGSGKMNTYYKINKIDNDFVYSYVNTFDYDGNNTVVGFNFKESVNQIKFDLNSEVNQTVYIQLTTRERLDNDIVGNLSVPSIKVYDGNLSLNDNYYVCTPYQIGGRPQSSVLKLELEKNKTYTIEMNYNITEVQRWDLQVFDINDYENYSNISIHSDYDNKLSNEQAPFN